MPKRSAKQINAHPHEVSCAGSCIAYAVLCHWLSVAYDPLTTAPNDCYPTGIRFVLITMTFQMTVSGKQLEQAFRPEMNIELEEGTRRMLTDNRSPLPHGRAGSARHVLWPRLLPARVFNAACCLGYTVLTGTPESTSSRPLPCVALGPGNDQTSITPFRGPHCTYIRHIHSSPSSIFAFPLPLPMLLSGLS